MTTKGTPKIISSGKVLDAFVDCPGGGSFKLENEVGDKVNMEIEREDEAQYHVTITKNGKLMYPNPYIDRQGKVYGIDEGCYYDGVVAKLGGVFILRFRPKGGNMMQLEIEGKTFLWYELLGTAKIPAYQL